MTFEEMLEFTVLGGFATCDAMTAESYVSYNFSGWRINFGGGKGSSSGLTFCDEWKCAEWREYVEPVKAWPIAKVKPVLVRGGMQMGKTVELELNDIEWQQQAKPNPWAEIKAKQTGWVSYE